jgi:rhodanese-related sulfurtransferase
MFGEKTRTVVVVGAQWGDEGKGKLVDVLAERADWVVRYQGGANAGHTVYVGDATIVLHQIPSGILHSGVRCAIGNGVVLDPDTLFEEIDELVRDGVDVEGRLYVSDRAHLVLPYHKLLDAEDPANKVIGTTGRGIGPAYEDKVARRGVRVLDLRHDARLRELVERGVENANAQLASFGSAARVGVDDVVGSLHWGMIDWRSEGLPLETVPQITVHELEDWMDEHRDVVVVDVREPSEWMEGHIPSALHVPMLEALRRQAELPRERPKAVLCAGGLRSSTVISALKRHGITNWYNVTGGMTAWLKAGYPVTKQR